MALMGVTRGFFPTPEEGGGHGYSMMDNKYAGDWDFFPQGILQYFFNFF